MPFSRKDLTNYVFKGNVPREAMVQLNKLLFKELKEYCLICQDDRMNCVLSPLCPKRILIKVRIQSGALYEDLPKFCYSQAINNIKRYLNHKTTLYTPQDELIFNKDFLDLMFPKLSKKILKNQKDNLEEVHNLIEKSKIPAFHLDVRHGNRDLFEKIIKSDKLIKEGSFIYDIDGIFLLIWHDKSINITNFKSGITIVNAKEDVIEDLSVIDLVFHIYCSELDVIGMTTLNSQHRLTLTMRIPFSNISEENLKPESTYFQELISFLQQYFFKIEISLDPLENLVISLKYQNLSHFLKKNKLSILTYNTIYNLIKMMAELRVFNLNK